MTPAERLRAAATWLREVAEDATPGSWEVIGGGEYLQGPDILVGGGVGSTTATDADYIATMHPYVALALADWLDHEARMADWEYETPPEALRVAEAILGGTS